MKLVTNGGRVLGITAIGKTLSDAITNAYMAISEVDFEDIYYRDDIGLKGLGYELNINQSLESTNAKL
jgi:phosphoribosylamine-glycine ligase